MNADGQKRAGGAIIDGQKRKYRKISRNYARFSCTRTMKSRVFLFRGSVFNEAAFLPAPANSVKHSPF
jgi:hypothetical protein